MVISVVSLLVFAGCNQTDAGPQGDPETPTSENQSLGPGSGEAPPGQVPPAEEPEAPVDAPPEVQQEEVEGMPKANESAQPGEQPPVEQPPEEPSAEKPEEPQEPSPEPEVPEGEEGFKGKTDCNVCPTNRVYVVNGRVCADQACSCVAAETNYCTMKAFWDKLEVAFTFNNTYGKELNYLTVSANCTRNGEAVSFQGGTVFLYESKDVGYPASKTIITVIKESGYLRYFFKFFEGNLFKGTDETKLSCSVVYVLKEDPSFAARDSFSLHVRKASG
ncbi:hypothetical protein COY95_01425 [Candidatus Woesearchaeota archaeon CG_4_10_14_0_8_um_filter_47_5]|nr:MAG: hypothetical protein COY95_01425 [Candidatus Woesearchaeota archaeon CG_4_10_14_0_8_um_filter_47_5]